MRSGPALCSATGGSNRVLHDTCRCTNVTTVTRHMWPVGRKGVPYSRTMLAALTFLVVFVLAFGFPALAQQTTGAQRPADQQAQRTTTPALHNGKIVFAGILPRDARTTNNWEIYTVNADGSGFAKLTNNPATDVYPSWSADGRKIAFES